MIRIGVRSLEQAIRTLGGDRDVEAGLRAHFRRLDDALSQGKSPRPAPPSDPNGDVSVQAAGSVPLPDLFLALCESVAEKYLEREKPEQAPLVVWEAFASSPRLAEYRALRDWAQRAGGWPDWRAKAWELLRERGGDAVAILLWEGDLEQAWKEAAASGASDEQWMELARRREQDHPDDAERIYRDQIPRLLARSDPAAYRDALRGLRRLESLLGHLGRMAEFRTFLRALRADSRRRPRWARMLDEAFGPP